MLNGGSRSVQTPNISVQKFRYRSNCFCPGNYTMVQDGNVVLVTTLPFYKSSVNFRIDSKQEKNNRRIDLIKNLRLNLVISLMAIIISIDQYLSLIFQLYTQTHT